MEIIAEVYIAEPTPAGLMVEIAGQSMSYDEHTVIVVKNWTAIPTPGTKLHFYNCDILSFDGESAEIDATHFTHVG